MKDLPARRFRWRSSTAGSKGRSGSDDHRLPPGQQLTDDFPVLSASVTPLIPKDKVDGHVGDRVQRRWSWHDVLALPSESVLADILLPKRLHLSQKQLSRHRHPRLRLKLRRPAQRRPSLQPSPEIVLRLSSGLPPSRHPPSPTVEVPIPGLGLEMSGRPLASRARPRRTAAVHRPRSTPRPAGQHPRHQHHVGSQRDGPAQGHGPLDLDDAGLGDVSATPTTPSSEHGAASRRSARFGDATREHVQVLRIRSPAPGAPGRPTRREPSPGGRDAWDDPRTKRRIRMGNLALAGEAALLEALVESRCDAVVLPRNEKVVGPTSTGGPTGSAWRGGSTRPADNVRICRIEDVR